jgi:hypothetical protein
MEDESSTENSGNILGKSELTLSHELTTFEKKMEHQHKMPD